MTMPTFEEASRLRAAIARDQTRYWLHMFWQPAKTKRELDRRERNWFWWGSIGWQAQLAARGVLLKLERSWANER